jgi:AraC family transcriptional regulator of adaptative response/methylated-DNA-[protein]-cysteine methyltransferase
MESQNKWNYERIAEAIHFLQQHYREQPELDYVAQQMHISPFHFQRLFTEWAGVSPKKFVQYLSIGYAKQLLAKGESTLENAAYQTGLSGTGRLHDLFVGLDGMTPGEFKNEAANLTIQYSFSECRFGPILLASTAKGLCSLSFMTEKQQAVRNLQSEFPKALLIERKDTFQNTALALLEGNNGEKNILRLHLRGTNFQLKVWEALLKIPPGQLRTYGNIANAVGKPKAARAVGGAIGSNPVALLIPCHRIIQNSGIIGGYRWGATRKQAILGWEAAQLESKS